MRGNEVKLVPLYAHVVNPRSVTSCLKKTTMDNVIILKNFDSLCRLCLVSGVELIKIFGDSNLGSRYVDEPLSAKIYACTSLQVSEEDELPDSICKSCSLKIMRAYEFRQQANRSNEILRRFIQDKEYRKQRELTGRQIHESYEDCKIDDSDQMLVEELEVEPLTYCVKVECDVEHEENSNLVADEYETSNGYNGDTTFDTSIIDNESTEDRFKSVRREYEQPGWMNNGEDDENISLGENNGVISETVSVFVCQYCNSSLPTEEKFNRHSLIHTSEPPFPCDYCEESFDLRTDLKSHWKVHSDGNPHICPMCGKSFPDRMLYLKHSELHDQVKPFKCPVCQKSFCYGSDLRKHAITHTGVRPFVCSICGNSFTRSTSLNKHLKMHNGNRPFSCPSCPKIFGSRGDLKRHQIIHSGIKPWICTVCSVPFNRKDKLVRHEKLHSGEPRPFQCYECPTSFSRKEDLTKHIQFHHYKPPANIENLSANGTDKNAIEHSTLDQISKSDLERGNRTFRALIREAFSGAQTNNGWSQTSIVHTNATVISNAAATSAPIIISPNQNSTQLSHQKQQHYQQLAKSEDLLFKCDVCHKKFTQKQSLDSHKKIHTAVKPYGCSMCDKSFYRRRELTRHEAVHTGYKPFSCGVCGKCFSRTDKLNRHVQTHQYKSVFRNYNCESCSLNFRTEQELEKHRPLCKPELAMDIKIEESQEITSATDNGEEPELIVPDKENARESDTKIVDEEIRDKSKIEIVSKVMLTKLGQNSEIVLLPVNNLN